MRYFPLLSIVLFFDSVLGFNLECSISSGGWGTIGYFKYCEATNLVTTASDQTVTTINGQDASYFNSQDFKGLLLSNIDFMPLDLEKFFPNLEGIGVSASKMTSLKQSDMKTFTKLRQIHWHDSEIQEIENDLFEFNPDLEYLYIHSNKKLKSVGVNVFENLAKLKMIVFVANNCISKNVNSKSEIPSFITELARKCPPTTAMMRDSLLKILKTPQEMLDKFAEMEAKINDLKLRLMDTEAKYKSCDGNLDAALLNLSMLKRKEKSKDEITKPIIDLFCETKDQSHCDVQQLKVPLDGLSITEIKTKTGEIFDSSQIKKLTVANQETLFLPNNLAHHFPQLQDLIVTNSGLYELDESNFHGFDGLISLLLDHNKLQEIPTKTFHQLKNLLILDLSFNKLEHVNNGLFLGLAKLQQLKLNNNFLQSVKYNDFDGLFALEELSLENNKLIIITSNILSQFNKLSSADLTNNYCIDKKYPRDTKEEIEKEVAEYCTAPIGLECLFQDEQIQLAEATFFSGYSCKAQNLKIEQPGVKILKVLDDQAAGYDKATVFVVSEQPIMYLPLNLAELIPNVEKIVVDRTKLSKIQKSDFKGFTGLKMLLLWNNDISSIDTGAFDDVSQIEYLSLMNNKLSTLPPNLFAQLIHLKTLILSRNILTRLTADLLPTKNALEQFSVDQNKLGFIATKLFRSLKKAKIIDLRTNKCIDMMIDLSTDGGNTFAELHSQVDMNCNDDD